MTDWRIGVEIATAGMDWPASTGPTTVTMEHLADAVAAANDDPHVQVPRVRLGHTSALNDGMPRNDPFAALGDAEPAFGRFTNLRLTNDGAVLVGDVIDTPDWLTEGAPTLFPSRSMEANWDVQTPGGKRYSMVVTAVSLLGVYLPAVQDLEDLVSFALNGPEATMPRTTAASVSTSVVRERFNFEWTMSEPLDGLDTYWWWVRDVRVDPDEVIADDDEGNLWSVPYTTDGEDAVTFGEPTKVRETYVPVAAAAASITASAPESQRVLATFSRPSKKDRPNPAASRPDNERNPMDEAVRKALAAAHGLDPDTATEDDVNAAVLAAQTDADAAAAAEAERLAAEEAANATEEPEPEVEEPATVSVSQEVYEEQQRRLEALEADKAERELAAATARRDGLADKWVRERRITPAERALARSNLDIDETKTVETYEALATNRVPTVTRGGADNAPSATTGSDALVAASRARMGHTPKEA